MSNLDLSLTPEQVEIVLISISEKQEELTQSLSVTNREYDDPICEEMRDAEAYLLDLIGVLDRHLK